MMDLGDTIADYIASWKEPYILQEIFHTPNPYEVAQHLYTFCEAEFGRIPERVIFFAASQGVVFGLRLYDGRRVVVKVHPPHQSPAFLAQMGQVQHYLAERGYPCPRPVQGPRPLVAGYATVEELIDEGEYRDAHDPVVRQAMAAAFARLFQLTSEPEIVSMLQSALFDHRLPPDVLWPRPHNAIFNFEATAAGAEWIDELAHSARKTIDADQSKLVLVQYPENVPCSHLAQPLSVYMKKPKRSSGFTLGHADFSVKQMRFMGNSIRVIYDWDSLLLNKEAVFVGKTAVNFPYSEQPGIANLPTQQEALAFVAEYEAARGQSFTKEERKVIAAGATLEIAYGARCEHSLYPQKQVYPADSLRSLLATYGANFLQVMS